MQLNVFCCEYILFKISKYIIIIFFVENSSLSSCLKVNFNLIILSKSKVMFEFSKSEYS